MSSPFRGTGRLLGVIDGWKIRAVERVRSCCSVCAEPVSNPPPAAAVHGPEDWLCVKHAAEERELMKVAGEAGHCPDCRFGTFEEPAESCSRHRSTP